MNLLPDEPARPTIISRNHDGIVEILSDNHGLTIRQEFAVRLMSGMLANNASNALNTSYIAKMAVNAADDLIKELNEH
jgi:hypothetical protein